MSLQPGKPPSLLQRLSPKAAAVLVPVTAAARVLNLPAYLVGGIVRDLLLQRESLDVDIVVEGDAVRLAQASAGANKDKITAHAQFGTASTVIEGVTVDFVTARTEAYPRPGGLPVVRPSTIHDDLRRRDFTINAMAISINPAHSGQLIDPLGGSSDLQNGLVRVIHDQSFADDATRMLRAVRYEQRFAFHLEPRTEVLLRQQVMMLSTISGERVRYEIERIFGEKRPEDPLSRAHDLGLLRTIHPSVVWSSAAGAGFREARQSGGATAPVLASVWLASIQGASIDEIASRLAFSSAWTRTVKATKDLMASVSVLERPALANSELYELLNRHSVDTILACRAMARSPITTIRLDLFVSSLRHVKTALTGKDLLEMGMASGPKIGIALNVLKMARLDGHVAARAEEVEFISRWMEANGQ